ncbi:hypothetical protein G3O06_05860 [Burkholderia sp. Ac-20345]|uniref:hypothetical protein n=1 Tax=Burkholderia sp. Ac-20345 TaxID=2703891 RepID=UPI00197CB0E3|nr:hypothetical protein [Burkholderia sp. Ac-20345]MBN3777093.1 hypothetical protein [Burkholderia sp. Ac-20345]
MEYRTVFDVAEAGYKAWSSPAFGLIFVVIGSVLVARRKSLPGWWSEHPRASAAFTFYFFGFAILWTLIAFFSTYSEYSSLSKARMTNDVRVVEGVVTNFKPMPVTGHAMERFCVSGECFEYSDYVVTGGFNNTSSHGGPIREGLQVRVSYVGNSIVKLEVAK